MILFVSKTSDILYKQPFDIETITDYICLNPNYPAVTISNPSANILMDSGAFQDIHDHKRTTMEKALERQIQLEKRVNMVSKRIVAYDYIDNLDETIKANQFLASKRDLLYPRQLVLVSQGTTVREYILCLKEVLKMSKPEDCIALGGLARASINADMKTKLLDSFKYCLPEIYKKGVKDIHLFGISSFDILKEIREIEQLFCDLLDIPHDHFSISCDTATFEIRSVLGSVINETTEMWEKVYSKEDKRVNYDPNALAKRNIRVGTNIISKI